MEADLEGMVVIAAPPMVNDQNINGSLLTLLAITAFVGRKLVHLSFFRQPFDRMFFTLYPFLPPCTLSRPAYEVSHGSVITSLHFAVQVGFKPVSLSMKKHFT